jgi:DNA helicase TIP49 (TBP-interacting protein)
MASWSMIVAANPAVLLCFPRVGGTEVFSHEETEALLAALRNGVEVRIRPLDAGRIRNTKRRSNDRG